jgi:hypothetical protein
MHGTFQTPVEPGRHTLRIRNGWNSSPTATFDAGEGQVIAFRCSGEHPADLSPVVRGAVPGDLAQGE